MTFEQLKRIKQGNDLADRLEACLDRMLKIMQENSKTLNKAA